MHASHAPQLSHVTTISLYRMWLPQAGMKDGMSGNYVYISHHTWPSMKENHIAYYRCRFVMVILKSIIILYMILNEEGNTLQQFFIGNPTQSMHSES